jgi:pimeloyl-ACP methyl ester carboxylesterase
MWDAQFSFFSDYYQVIRYDTRGFGKTNSANVSFSNRQDLRDLLDYLKVDKAYVVGLSRGGQIATDFTLEFPERVAALVPVAAGLGGFQGELLPNELVKEEEVEKLEENKEYEKAAQLGAEIWVSGFYRSPDEVDPKVLAKVRQMVLDNSISHQDEHPEPRTLTPPAVGRLAEIKVPTLVIVGDIDESVIMPMADKMATDIPGAKKVIFPGVAHMVNMEKPKEFNQILLDFLKGL